MIVVSISGGAGFDYEQCLTVCEQWLDALQPTFDMRLDDGEIQSYSISRERGNERGNPHLQCCYIIKSTITDANRRVNDEKAWLRPIIVEASDITDGKNTGRMCFRLQMKNGKIEEAGYQFGYTLKDKCLEHYLNINGGLATCPTKSV